MIDYHYIKDILKGLITMSNETIEKVANVADTVETIYNKEDKTWRNVLASNTSEILSQHDDREEAVVNGKNLSKEKGFAHTVRTKNGRSMFKMIHQ